MSGKPKNTSKALIATIPHSGEKVPEFCEWLQGLPEPLLMCDVDRFVDHLYEAALQQLRIPFAKTEWHRYAADLNRIPEDVDASSVVGHAKPAGTNARGFHWVITTKNEPLMKQPMPHDQHKQLVELIYEPFHQSVRDLYENQHKQGHQEIFHLDLHSMPSLGTKQHRDPGERRADIVVSDCLGKSSRRDFVDVVIAAYARAGFKVGYNWPYMGGRVSEQYGQPAKGHHTVQVELNRSLYMDEDTKKLKVDLLGGIQSKLLAALTDILAQMP